MTIINNNGRYYSGAGVLIIEDYYRKDGSIEPCILLVRNKASGEYTDFGGTYEKKHGSLEKTAIDELREESRNLFNIDIKYFIDHVNNYVDITAGKDTFYKAFFIKINGISRKYYLHNMRLIESLHKKGVKISRVWRETDDIAHIPISRINFIKIGERGKIILKDIDDRNISIKTRIKKILYEGRSLIINDRHKIASIEPMGKRADMQLISSSDLMNGTYSFIIKKK